MGCFEGLPSFDRRRAGTYWKQGNPEFKRLGEDIDLLSTGPRSLAIEIPPILRTYDPRPAHHCHDTSRVRPARAYRPPVYARLLLRSGGADSQIRHHSGGNARETSEG